MKYLVTLLMTALMTAHAALGCCAHHEHPVTTEHASVCCHQHEHSQTADSHSTPENQPTPQECDEERCLFVAPENSTHGMLDLSGLIAPLFMSIPPCPAANAVAIRGSATVEDVLHPAGPALHLWHCLLVI